MAIRATGDPWLDRYLGAAVGEDDATPPEDVESQHALPPVPDSIAPSSPESNPYITAMLGGGGGGELAAPPPDSSASGGHALRDAWNTVTAPVNAITGLSGTSALHLLGIPKIFPHAYDLAKQEKTRSLTGGVDRPLSALETAESLPGLGDVVTSEWNPDTLAGRIARPIAQLGLNIAGDPLTYVGPGLAKLTKVGKTAAAVKAAALGAEVASGAGDVARAAELTRSIPSLEQALQAARAGETGLAAAGRHALSAVALPYTPMGGLIYAPEMIESTIDSARNSYEEARAGRYQNAAASGVGALMTAALGALVGKGLIDEHKAAGVLERTLGKTLGESVPSDLAPAAGTLPPENAAGMPDRIEPGVASQPAQEVAPPPAVAPAPVPQPTSAGAPVPASTAPVQPAPQIARPVFDPTTQPELHAKQQKAIELLSSKSPTDTLTKRELYDAGLITRRQFKDGRMAELVADLGVPDIAARLEKAQGISGGGFRLRPESVEGTQSVETVAPGPSSAPVPVGQGTEAAAVATSQVPPGAVPPAESVQPPTTATPAKPPTPSKLTRADIDLQLENPDLRKMTGETLQELADSHGITLHDLTPQHVREAFPGDEQKPTRALLNRALEAQKKIKRVAVEEAAAAEASVGAAPAPVPTPAPLHLVEAAEAPQAVPRSRQQPPPEVAESVPQSAVEPVEPVTTVNADGVPVTVLPRAAVRESGLTAQPTHHGQYPKKLREPNLDVLADTRGTSGPGGEQPKVESVRRTVADYITQHDLDPATFAAAAERVLGKTPDAASPGELHQLISYADRHPEEFGREALPPIDTEEVRKATARLVGGTGHLDYDESKLRDFRYDPSSPAGNVQRWAREHGLEEGLQDTLTDWLGIIAGHGSDRPRRNLDSITANLERLMAEPDEAKARRELTKLLQSDMKFRQKNELAKARRHERLSAQAAEGLHPDEKNRFAAHEEPMPLPEPDASVDLADMDVEAPARPADVDPKSWRAQVQSDPDLLKEYRQSLAATAMQWQQGKTTSAARSGVADEASSWMKTARQMADDLGIRYDKKRGADRLLRSLNRVLAEDGPHASRIGNLLSDAAVAKNGPQYTRMLKTALRLADTDAVVADFEQDASHLLRPVADLTGDAADTLSRVTQDIANITDLPSRFGGFTVSPQLDGIRHDGSVYINPANAFRQAMTDLADTKLTGQARADALSYATSKNLLDTLLHEITHRKARHDAAAGDLAFTEAYADVTASVRDHYGDMIRDIQSAIEKKLPGYETQIDPIYSKMLEAHLARTEAGAGAGAAAEAGAISRPSDAAGSGARRIAPIPDRPGRGAGGALGSVGDGVGSARTVPGGEPKPTAAVREGTATVEGAAASERAAGGADRGAGVGESAADTHANLTEDLSKALANRRSKTELQKVERAMAASVAKYSGNPTITADDILRKIELTEALPESVKAKLRTAGPKREFDTRLNMSRIPADAMSPEQRQTVSAALWLRDRIEPSKPMSYADVDAGMRALLNVHTPEEFVKLSERTGLRDPRDFALMRTIHATFSADVDRSLNMLREAKIKGDPEMQAFAKDKLAMSWAKSDAVLSVLLPETTRAARILSFQRMMMHPLSSEETFRSRFFGAMRAAKIKDDKAHELFTMLNDTLSKGSAGDWTTFTNAFREATRARGFDKFLEFWKAGLLGWTTQIGNIASNGGMAVLRNSEHAATALVDTGVSKLTGAPRTRHVGEIAMRMTGLKHAVSDAIPMLTSDLRDIFTLQRPNIDRRLSEGSFYDDPGIHNLFGAIEGKKGEFVRIPFKLLDAADNFFKHIARNQEYAAQAHRIASNPEMRMKAIGPGQNNTMSAANTIYHELRRVAADPFSNTHIYEKPGYKEALMAGRKAAISDTFQDSLGPVMRKAYESTQAHPALQFLFPFVKTPYNILAEGMRRTPLAAMYAIQQYASGKIDNPKFVEDMVKSTIGTLIMGVTASAALDGTITGGGPADPKEAELLKRTGWQPYSIKVPVDGKNQYISYQRLEPFATMLGLASDAGEAWKAKDHDTGGDLIKKGVAAISDNLTNKSFLTGLESLVKIMTDPQRSGMSAIRQLQASLVPNIVGVVPFAHAARALDDKYRETEALTASPFIAQIPGLSQTLPEQKTPTGETRKRVGSPLERLFSPFQRSEERTDPISHAAAEISRLGVSVEAPPLYTKVGQDKVYYTEEEREQLSQAQQRAMEKIASVISRADYTRLPDQPELTTADRMTKVKAIRNIISRYRDPVREHINRQAVRRERSLQRG